MTSLVHLHVPFSPGRLFTPLSSPILSGCEVVMINRCGLGADRLMFLKLLSALLIEMLVAIAPNRRLGQLRIPPVPVTDVHVQTPGLWTSARRERRSLSRPALLWVMRMIRSVISRHPTRTSRRLLPRRKATALAKAAVSTRRRSVLRLAPRVSSPPCSRSSCPP